MKISIIIVSYNRKEFTKYCIDSINKNTDKKRYELIVVDNKSTDGAIEMLQKMENNNQIDKLILNDENLFLGKAMNKGFEISDKYYDWIVVFSNDTFVMDGWVDNLEIVINDLNLQYLYVTARVACYHRKIPLVTKNGGKYMSKDKITKKSKHYDRGIGGGLAISRKLYNKLKPLFPEKYIHSPFTSLRDKFEKLGIHKTVDLDKPCALTQDEQFDNPKYREYYEEIFQRKNKKRKTINNFINRGTRLDRGSDRYYKYYKGTEYLEDKNSTCYIKK